MGTDRSVRSHWRPGTRDLWLGTERSVPFGWRPLESSHIKNIIMTSNLKFRLLTIVAVILVCVYGIIGLPKSKEELIQNWKGNIHLGLDLSGGSHLIMEVHLQDAFKGEADAVIARLKDECTKAGIPFAGT